MKVVTETAIDEIAEALNRPGSVVVLRTDTVYGLLARAEDEEAYRRIFAIKGRDAEKQCIVLVASYEQMWDEASRTACAAAMETIDDSHPASLILPTAALTPAWLHHGTNRLAFRQPSNLPWLLELIEKTGPLIAPSANPQGKPTATSVKEAQGYFGDDVSLYVDGSTVTHNEPSHLYDVGNDTIERLR